MSNATSSLMGALSAGHAAHGHKAKARAAGGAGFAQILNAARATPASIPSQPVMTAWSPAHHGHGHRHASHPVNAVLKQGTAKYGTT